MVEEWDYPSFSSKGRKRRNGRFFSFFQRGATMKEIVGLSSSHKKKTKKNPPQQAEIDADPASSHDDWTRSPTPSFFSPRTLGVLPSSFFSCGGSGTQTRSRRATLSPFPFSFRAVAGRTERVPARDKVLPFSSFPFGRARRGRPALFFFLFRGVIRRERAEERRMVTFPPPPPLFFLLGTACRGSESRCSSEESSFPPKHKNPPPPPVAAGRRATGRKRIPPLLRGGRGEGTGRGGGFLPPPLFSLAARGPPPDGTLFFSSGEMAVIAAWSFLPLRSGRRRHRRAAPPPFFFFSPWQGEKDELAQNSLPLSFRPSGARIPTAGGAFSPPS